jgi:hypothetical protein
MEKQSSSANDAAAPIALPQGDPQTGLYRHYKGGMYRVLGLVRHSETLEVMVLYQALYGTRGQWVRPRAMFLETVSHDGVVVPRFARVADTDEPAVDSPDNGPDGGSTGNRPN